MVSLPSILLKRMREAATVEEVRQSRPRRVQRKERYLQLAFNENRAQAHRILPEIMASERILIEAGTPYIKREGIAGIRAIRARWSGHIVADLKTSDGGAEEVAMVRDAGATAVTASGSSPVETLNRFVVACEQMGLDAMIDMLGVSDPLRVLMKLRKPPRVVVLHRGRDEEGTRGKVIQYRHVNRVLSKFDVLISAAGGVDLREARSAIFNGANIVVVNIISPGKPWEGIPADADVGAMSRQFLHTIE
jgi:bifunctional enzyme Fae/Hps